MVATADTADTATATAAATVAAAADELAAVAGAGWYSWPTAGECVAHEVNGGTWLLDRWSASVFVVLPGCKTSISDLHTMPDKAPEPS